MNLFEILQEVNLPFYDLKMTKHEVVVEQGQVADKLFFVRHGVLRMGHLTPDGKDVTVQFFFEGSQVALIASFASQLPSDYFLEALEDCQLTYVRLNDFMSVVEENPAIKDVLMQLILSKMTFYSDLFLSRIQYSPEGRYQELQENYADLLQRVPDQYLASYLGITPVSFSRIKKRLS